MNLVKNLRKLIKKREMINFYRNYISREDLCFDVGANSGQRTDIFLNLGAKVIAVEPQRNCLEILKSKYAGTDRVTILDCAIGSKNGEDILMICEETDQCATLSGDFIKTFNDISGLHWSTTEEIKVRTLDHLCEQYGVPKFCKIDVEGWESEVMKGLSIPIDFISFEFNMPLIRDTHTSLEILGSTAEYKCNFIRYEHMKLELSAWVPLNEFRSKLEKFIHPGIETGEIMVKRMKGSG